jgi:hypothetical protein
MDFFSLKPVKHPTNRENSLAEKPMISSIRVSWPAAVISAII